MEKKINKPSPRRAKGGRGKNKGVLALVCSFGCGTGSAVLLMAICALVFERTALPLQLVKPVACAVAGVGAMVSGAVLAGFLGRQRLLCGLGCGVFYCLCLLAATLIRAGGIALEGSNVTLLAALLLGGAAGGAFSALKSQGHGGVR